MKHLKIILTSIFFLSALPHGQSTGTPADSLEQLLATLPRDTHRINVLNELSWLYKDADILKARSYAQEGLALAESLKYDKGIADACTRLGLTYKKEERYDSALAWYEKGLEIRMKLKDHSLVASSLLNIATIYKEKGDLEGAIETYKRGLGYLSMEEDQEVRAKIYNKLGGIYADQGSLPDALSHFEEALKLGQAMKDTVLMAGILMSMGELHRKQQHYKLGLEAYTQAMEFYRKKQNSLGIAKCYHNLGNMHFLREEYGQALENFNACIRLLKELGITKDIAHVYQSVAAVHEAQGKLDTALYYHQISLRLRQEAGEKIEIAHSLINIGQIKLAQKQYEQALSNFMDALPATEEEKDVFTLEDLYGHIAQAYYALGDFKNAFQYSNKQRELAEELKGAYRQTVELQLSLAAEKQKREKAEKETAVAQKEIENKTAQSRAYKAILLLGVVLFAVVFLASRMRTKKERAEQKARLAVMHIDEVMREQELRSAYDKLQGQEVERKRIGKDLHDRLGSMLSTVKLYFKALDNRTPFTDEPQNTQYNKAKKLLDDACEELRRVSHNLESGGLKEYGLVRQVAALAENLESSQLLKVNFHTHGLKGRLDLDTEISIYRIIQELVANVLKHAKATELTIQLNKLNGTFNIMVEDNGVGFTRESVKHKQSGMGIQNIAERVKELNGNLTIDSGKGGGTTVSIDLPFQG